MRTGPWREVIVTAVVAVIVSTVALTVRAHYQAGAPGAGAPDAVPPANHEAHGVPKDWAFAMPKGDVAHGRELFAKFECYKCHDVSGESFPKATDGENVGPELAEESAQHPAAFLAESILNPNAVIDEPKFRAPDGSSRMPSFNDSMTVRELIDLVAFLQNLTPPSKGAARDHKH
jgi:mono/diheme cytochrome c family protein